MSAVHPIFVFFLLWPRLHIRLGGIHLLLIPQPEHNRHAKLYCVIVCWFHCMCIKKGMRHSNEMEGRECPDEIISTPLSENAASDISLFWFFLLSQPLAPWHRNWPLLERYDTPNLSNNWWGSGWLLLFSVCFFFFFVCSPTTNHLNNN